MLGTLFGRFICIAINLFYLDVLTWEVWLSESNLMARSALIHIQISIKGIYLSLRSAFLIVSCQYLPPTGKPTHLLFYSLFS